MPRSDTYKPAPIEQIHDYPTLFEQFRKRPAMWLGCKSLSSFEACLTGIRYAEYIYRVPRAEWLTRFDFGAFHVWADSKFNPGRLSINTFGMARRCTACDEDAFDKWFEWVDEFLAETASPDVD